MTTGTEQGLNYHHVVSNEEIPLQSELTYAQGGCGYVYAKLYNSKALPNNITQIFDRSSLLNTEGDPSVCALALGTENLEEATNTSDHNIVIGYFGREITDNDLYNCDRGESSILNYNFPLERVRHVYPALGSDVINHPVHFVRNLVANKTCVAPIYMKSNGQVDLNNLRASENLPILSKYQVGNDQCHIVVAKLYYSHNLDVPVATLAGGNYDKKTKVATVGLDITRTDIYGRRNRAGFYYGDPGSTIADTFGGPNVVVAAVTKSTYNVLGYRAYQEYYQSQQTGNITEYARRQGISVPYFVGTLSYPIDCERKYLANAEYSFDDAVHFEQLPLGIHLRLKDGTCVRNIIKTYNATNYNQEVDRLPQYRFEHHSGREDPVFLVTSYDNLASSLSGYEPRPDRNESSIAEVFGEHNVVHQYLEFGATIYNMGEPLYVREANENSNINEYRVLSNYQTDFVANLLYPEECDGTEALSYSDVQKYSSRTSGLTHNNDYNNDYNNDCSSQSNTLSYVGAAFGGMLFGGFIITSIFLLFKCIKSKCFTSKATYQVQEAKDQETKLNIV